MVRDHKAAGSSPATPTIFLGFLFVWRKFDFQTSVLFQHMSADRISQQRILKNRAKKAGYIVFAL